MKKITLVTVGLWLGLMLTSTNALVPPKYLSVPNWQSCVSTITRGSASFVCLPNAKPLKCPNDSWKVLKDQRLIDFCAK